MKYTENIKNKGTFRYLLNKGKFYKGKFITIYYADSKRKKNLFGVCVSKQNGNAVCRNKMKRWVREVYKNEEFEIKKNITLVIMYKKSSTIEKLNFYIIEQEIINGLKDLKLYEKNNI